MMHQDSLEPAAIRFTLGRLQEPARRSGHFLPAFFMHLYHIQYSRVVCEKLLLIKLQVHKAVQSKKL